MPHNSNINDIDDYDNFEINTSSDLFRFIELRLKECRGLKKIIKKVKDKTESGGFKKVITMPKLNVDEHFRLAYEEALGYARTLMKFDNKLIKPPSPTPNFEKNLKLLRDWCTDPRRQEKVEQHTPGQNIIKIHSKHFSKGKTWRLLFNIINDSRREGVVCENARTLRTLKERLKKAANDCNHNDYGVLAKNLKWNKGRAWTKIPAGKIVIDPKNFSA